MFVSAVHRLETTSLNEFYLDLSVDILKYLPVFLVRCFGLQDFDNSASLAEILSKFLTAETLRSH